MFPATAPTSTSPLLSLQHKHLAHLGGFSETTSPPASPSTPLWSSLIHSLTVEGIGPSTSSPPHRTPALHLTLAVVQSSITWGPRRGARRSGYVMKVRDVLQRLHCMLKRGLFSLFLSVTSREASLWHWQIKHFVFKSPSWTESRNCCHGIWATGSNDLKKFWLKHFFVHQLILTQNKEFNNRYNVG